MSLDLRIALIPRFCLSLDALKIFLTLSKESVKKFGKWKVFITSAFLSILEICTGLYQPGLPTVCKLIFPTGRAGKREINFLQGRAGKRATMFQWAGPRKGRRMIFQLSLGQKNKVFKPAEKKL